MEGFVAMISIITLCVFIAMIWFLPVFIAKKKADGRQRSYNGTFIAWYILWYYLDNSIMYGLF